MKVLQNYKRNQMILEEIFQGTNLYIMEGASGMHLGQTGFPGLHLPVYYFIEIPPINTLTHQPEPELFIPSGFCGPYGMKSYVYIFPGKTTGKKCLVNPYPECLTLLLGLETYSQELHLLLCDIILLFFNVRSPMLVDTSRVVFRNFPETYHSL